MRVSTVSWFNLPNIVCREGRGEPAHAGRVVSQAAEIRVGTKQLKLVASSNRA